MTSYEDELWAAASQDAFEAAENLVESVKDGYRIELSFDKPKFRSLERMPEGLGRLNGVVALNLENTRVSDISVVSRFQDLQYLSIKGTSVTDLRPLGPLTRLRKLALDGIPATDLRPIRWNSLLCVSEAIRSGGLSFANCGATLVDHQIAEISRIEDSADRAKALFEYLEIWKPQAEATLLPQLEPDPLLTSVILNGRIEVPAEPISEQDIKDKLKRQVHERLRKKVPELAAKAGNTYPVLAQKARELIPSVETQFQDLDILTIHLAVEDLQDRLDEGAEEGTSFSQELKRTLRAVTDSGPGLTLDHASVELLLDRRRRAREEADTDRKEAKRASLSKRIIADSEANGSRSRALEAQFQTLIDQVDAKLLREAKHRNLIWLLGTTANQSVALGVGVASSLIATAYGPSITEFVQANWPLLIEVAGTYGQGVAIWFQNTVGPIMAGVDTTAIRPINRRP